MTSSTAARPTERGESLAGVLLLLVSLVVFIFLGDWRSTLIPVLAVPVSLIGSFVFMQLFGITINLITLFALVLAIGVVLSTAQFAGAAVTSICTQSPRPASFGNDAFTQLC